MLGYDNYLGPNADTVSTIIVWLQLINTLIMKLPLAEHRNYADYITSEGNQVQSSSHWTTFWDRLRKRYDSSLQVRIMHFCFEQTDISRKNYTPLKNPLSSI